MILVPLLRRSMVLAACVFTPFADGAPLDYQVHGFGAQGFALSEGNNAVGDSTADGNYQYYELGLNGRVDLGYGFSLSAQELVRRSGSQDDGDLRLDYGFADYRTALGRSFDFGLRAGRVKNPFGLFNETRDLVFARPGIILPSVYFESLGTRSLLFSSDGVQMNAGWSYGEHYLSFDATAALNRDLNSDERRNFFGNAPIPGTIRLTDFYVARLMSDWSAGIVKLAASYLTADLLYVPGPGDPFSGSLAADIYLLSARYSGERLAVTGEYQLAVSKGSFGQPLESKSDGVYLQADYRFAHNWTATARFDASFSDRNDRSGENCTDNGAPSDRHGCFTLDAVAGVNWQPDEHWGVWGEFHVMDGYSNISSSENAGRTPDPHWNLLLLMAAYRF